MGILDRIASALGVTRLGSAAIHRLPGRRGALELRRFEAAAVNRLTESWLASSNAIDEELRADLDKLRARARDLAKNNEYMAKFLRMVRNNVIGQGMTLQSRPMDGTKLDGMAANAIEAHFRRWCAPAECDVTGRRGYWAIMRATANALARDGEALIRLCMGRGSYGLQLQVLDITRLDTALNRARVGTANAIIMGVEVDEFSRPVAYHLRTVLPGTTSLSPKGAETERVPADQIVHAYVGDEPEQTRGVPWAHAAMRRLNDLGGYREAAVIAARIGASKMGFYTTPEVDQVADGTDEATAVPYTAAAPGEFGVLPPGTSFQTFDPAYPHDQFGEFVKAALRGIASGMGVAYNSLANDLEGVNFSSIRSGVLEERDEWMVLQDWFIEQVLDPIFATWLRLALTNGAITQPGKAGPVSLPITKLDKFGEHVWQPRRWQWVDPLKDVEAAVLAIDNNLTTASDVAARSGLDLEDIFATKARERDLAAQYGIQLVPVGGIKSATGAASGQPAAADPTAGRALQDDHDIGNMIKLASRNHAAGGAVEFGLRVEPPPTPQPAPIVNVAAPVVNVAPAQVTVVNEVQPADVQPTPVTVQAQLGAPRVDVTVQVPPRRVDTSVLRDESGRIVGSTQIESGV